MSNIPIDTINTDFNENTEPQDDKLLALIRQAYQHEITCVDAMIATDKIKPFSEDYKPEISDKFRQHVEEKLRNEHFPKVFVYEDNGPFVMSDDYHLYYVYREKNIDPMPCVIIGGHGRDKVERYLSEPYYMPIPSVEIIDE